MFGGKRKSRHWEEERPDRGGFERREEESEQCVRQPKTCAGSEARGRCLWMSDRREHTSRHWRCDEVRLSPQGARTCKVGPGVLEARETLLQIPLEHRPLQRGEGAERGTSGLLLRRCVAR